jgi:alpha-tubulin suppressor-like RCC1 family protein
VRVGTAANWVSVTAGSDHTVAVQTDGSLWAWGGNISGQLGDGTVNARTQPTRIGTATWASVAAGSDFTVAVRTDATLWAWGYNMYGELGDGTTSDNHAPEQAGTATNWIRPGRIGPTSNDSAALASP